MCNGGVDADDEIQICDNGRGIREVHDITSIFDDRKRTVRSYLISGRSKLQVAGLRITFRNSPQGPADITLLHNGKPVGPDDKLTVATNNYLTTGGTGGKAFTEAGTAEDTMPPIRDLLIKDIKENPVKAAPEGGRITLLE